MNRVFFQASDGLFYYLDVVNGVLTPVLVDVPVIVPGPNGTHFRVVATPSGQLELIKV